MAIKFFNNFLRYAVLVVVALSVASLVLNTVYFITTSESIIPSVILILFLIFSVFVYRKYKLVIQSKLNNLLDMNLIPYIILLAFLLRIIWVYLVPSTPISDFALMYQTGKSVAQGNYDMLQGTNYFARFAHNTVAILYFSVFYRFTDNPLYIIKFFNVIFQTLTVYSIYLLAKEVYKDVRKARFIALLLSIFPPFVMYTSQTVSENMAMPFYILSVYFFFKSDSNKRKTLFLILTGLSLVTANMFRMVGFVFLVAYGVYLVIYKGPLQCLKKMTAIVIPYFTVLYIVSSLIMSAGITDTHIWASKEPSVTSILKGTNIKSVGRWNSEDAAVPDKFNYDSKLVKEESLRIIKERLTTTPVYRLTLFYVVKLSGQWGFGDFGAYSWTVPDAENTAFSNTLKRNAGFVMLICNFYLLLLFNKIFKLNVDKTLLRSSKDYFFIILLGGYVLLYLIIEMQARYSFIVSWIFILLSINTPHFSEGGNKLDKTL